MGTAQNAGQPNMYAAASAAFSVILLIGLTRGQEYQQTQEADIASTVRQISDIATKVADFTQDVNLKPLGDGADIGAQINQYADLAVKTSDLINGLGGGKNNAAEYVGEIDVEPKFVYDPKNPNARFNYNYPISAEAAKLLERLTLSPSLSTTLRIPMPASTTTTPSLLRLPSMLAQLMWSPSMCMMSTTQNPSTINTKVQLLPPINTLLQLLTHLTKAVNLVLYNSFCL